MNLKRQKQAQIEQTRQQALLSPSKGDLSLKKPETFQSSCNPLFQDSTKIKCLHPGSLQTFVDNNVDFIPKFLNYSDNQYVKNNLDIHDQCVTGLNILSNEVYDNDGDTITEYSQADLDSDENLDDISKFQKLSSRRPKATDDPLVKISRDCAFLKNQPISYNMLAEILQDPAIRQQNKKTFSKVYKNCMACENQIVMWVSHMKTSINIAQIKDEKVEWIRENVEISEEVGKIQQLILLKNKLIVRDSYNIRIFTIDREFFFEQIHHFNLETQLHSIVPSPFIRDQFCLMTVKGSNFYEIDHGELTPIFEFTLDLQKSITNDFIQDIQSFDYGFQPNTLFLSNFKHVFYYQGQQKVQILQTQKLNPEDLSFQKIHQVKNLNCEQYCILDEDSLRILNFHGPLKSIKHFQQEKVLFLDIVSNNNTVPFSYEDFENIDSLDFEEFQEKKDEISIMIYSGQFKDSSTLTLFENVLPVKEDEFMFNLLQNQFEKKPVQIQASPNFDPMAKIRGVCFFGDKILQSDNLGGLYFTNVKNQEKKEFKPKQIRELLNHKMGVFDSVKNVEYKCTYDELDCTEIVSNLLN